MGSYGGIAASSCVRDRVASTSAKVRALLCHNELELALDVLEAGAAEEKVSAEFWWHMKKAAEIMGLAERRKLFQVKMQEGRSGRKDT